MFPRPDRIIVPQYEPVEGISVIAAAELLGDSKRAVAAQLVDFAVRRIVSVARPEGKGTGSGFALTLVGLDRAADPATPAGQDEREILQAFFPQLRHAERRTIRKRGNRPLGVALREPHRRAVARLLAGGLARERGWFEKLVVFWQRQPTEPTDKAAPIVDHLWGIRDYVELAERDRFAMLQSPDGALRDAPLDGVEVLRLHERLLPYAVLFGLEQQWMAELDVRYRSLPPDVLESVEAAGELLEVVAVVGHTLEAVVAIGELVEVMQAADALEGVGAFLGGLGDALSNIDLPDFPDFG